MITLGALIFYFLVFSGLLFDSKFKNYETAHLEISIGDHRRAFEGEVVEGMTVLEAIQASALAGNIALNYTMDKNNEPVVISLDGYDNSKSKKILSFYVNDQKIDSKKIHLTSIADGDTIVIKSE